MRGRETLHLERAGELAARKLRKELDGAKLIDATQLRSPLLLLRVRAARLIRNKSGAAGVLVLLQDATLLALSRNIARARAEEVKASGG